MSHRSCPWTRHQHSHLHCSKHAASASFEVPVIAAYYLQTMIAPFEVPVLARLACVED